MDYRFATFSDIPDLVQANARFEADQGGAPSGSPKELEQLFWEWLGGDRRAVLFEKDGRTAGYALYKPDDTGAIDLERFCISDSGAAREAFELLIDEVWPEAASVRVETQAGDEDSLRMWRSLGFQDLTVRLERSGQRSQRAGRAEAS